MSLEQLSQQYNLLHNLLDKLEDQCQLWYEKQEITSGYASSIINLITQQNDAKSFLGKSNNDITIKQGTKIYSRNYISDYTSNGTTVVSFLPPLEFKSTYEACNNDTSYTMKDTTIVNKREKSNIDFGTKYDIEIHRETPAIVSFLSYYPDIIEKLLVKQQYNLEQIIKNFKEEAENFIIIKEAMIKIRHDAKNSVRMAYRKAIEMDNQKNNEGTSQNKNKNKGKNRSRSNSSISINGDDDSDKLMKEKVIDKMNTMEKANIPLVDLEMWIDKIVSCYEREWAVKEYLLKGLREGSLNEITDWDSWNNRWNSQSFLDFSFEQDVRDKIKAYKLIKTYEKAKEKEI